MTDKLNYIDLFAGAGGLSEGFKKAGFNPVAHVELSQSACFTLQTRAVYFYLKETGRIEKYHSYLKGDISRAQLYESAPPKIINTVINAAIGKDNKSIFKKIDSILNGDTVDLIVGGPPCQAYSYIGRAALKHKTEDERNTYYIHYGRFLNKYKPKLFVFENVPGIKTAGEGKYYRNLRKYFKKLGYVLQDRLVNAYDFGVIQNRHRLIIIGWREELDFTYPDFEKVIHNWNSEAIFSDLPAIKPGFNDRYCFYSSKCNEYLRANQIRNGEPFVTQHITRPHNKKDLAIYKLAIEKLHRDGKRLKNNEIPEKDRTQKNTKDFLDRFKVVATLPHTIIAHIAKDGHHFIYPDKKQLRSISVREAARIQSFPDDFFFEGIKESQSQTAAFRQIGNAVPPLMAFKIATKIREILNANPTKRP